MRSILILIFILIIPSFFTGCWHSDMDAKMDAADSLMESDADSAYTVLTQLNADHLSLSERDRARLKLLMIKAKNKAYLPLTQDDETTMKAIVEYYDEHGTRDDRVQAYYVLGSVYRDQKNAPAMINTFHKAIEVADTTSTDCDFATVSLILSQIANEYISQFLLDEADKINGEARHYALLSKDSLLVIDSELMSLHISNMQADHKTVRDNFMSVREKYLQHRDTVFGAKCILSGIHSKFELKDFSGMEKLISIYEKESKNVDENFNVKKGAEVYYYAKGIYLLHKGKPDSAYYFFRKELETTSDLNNRMIACKGLGMYYEKEGVLDSALKYSRLRGDAIVKDYDEKIKNNLQRLDAIYQYTYYKNLAKENREKRLSMLKMNRILQWACASVAVIIFIGFCIFFVPSWWRDLKIRIYNAKIKRLRKKQDRKLIELEESIRDIARDTERLAAEKVALCESECRMSAEIKHLRQVDADRQEKLELLKKDEEENRRRRAELNIRQREYDDSIKLIEENMSILRQNMNQEDIVRTLKKKSGIGKEATKEEWESVRHLINMIFPHFISTLKGFGISVSDVEIKVCMLTRLEFSSSEIACLMSKSPSNVVNIRTRLYNKVHGVDKSQSKEAIRWIMSLE